MITHNKNSTVGSKEDSLADLQKHDRNLEQVKESLEKFVGYIKEANAEVCIQSWFAYLLLSEMEAV